MWVIRGPANNDCNTQVRTTFCWSATGSEPSARGNRPLEDFNSHYATEGTKVELATLVAKADDPVATVKALQERLVENDYGYDVLAA